MSFFEKCRQTTVIVEDGSGVLFQPMTESYSYILTAKHNLYNDTDFGSYLDPKDLNDLNIVFYDGTALDNELEEDVLAKFEHQSLDIAILKIKKRDFITSFRNNKNINNSDEFKFYGFSGYKRTYLNLENRISHFNLIVGDQIILNKEIIVRNTERFTQEDILGCSGGGVFKEFNNDFLLIGIECRMDACSASERNNQRLRFITIDAFDEIIANNSSELESLYPPYLNDFDLLLDNIFLLTGMEEPEKRLIQDRLRLIAQNLSGKLKPIDIRKKFDKELLIEGSDINEFSNRELWSMYLEFLVISIFLDLYSPISIDAIDNIYKKRKFIFAKANDWIDLKEKILTSNLSRINKNGNVIICCDGDRTPTRLEMRSKSLINIANAILPENMRVDTSVGKVHEDLKFKHIHIVQKQMIDDYDKGAYDDATATNIEGIIKDEINKAFN